MEEMAVQLDMERCTRFLPTYMGKRRLSGQKELSGQRKQPAIGQGREEERMFDLP